MKTFDQYTIRQQIVLCTLMSIASNYATVETLEDDNCSWFTPNDLMKATRWSKQTLGGVMAGMKDENLITHWDDNEWFVNKETWTMIGEKVGRNVRLEDVASVAYPKTSEFHELL